MACTHDNPPAYAYCGTCGEPLETARCRCGFVNPLRNRHCGNCGLDLAVTRTDGAADPSRAAAGKYDLGALAAQAGVTGGATVTDGAAKASTEDIAQIIAAMKGGDE